MDQLELPGRMSWVQCRSAPQVARAIRAMQVRGAPAIGVAAGYGLALAAARSRAGTGRGMLADLRRAGKLLIRARPTAVNLSWAVNRVLSAAGAADSQAPHRLAGLVLDEARKIQAEDLAANRAIGRFGERLLRKGVTVLTHCNTGALATAGFGTALGVIRAAHRKGKIRRVLADETRPYLQGARLTAWELKRERIPFILITDSMAGYFMARGDVDAVLVGADRITARGDVANKIGTYSLACLAKAHRVPFLVAAPISTVDERIMDGSRIPIEERSSAEVLYIGKTALAPKGVRAAHPAFDVTPHSLVSALITERGVARPPFLTSLRRLLRLGRRGRGRDRVK